CTTRTTACSIDHWLGVCAVFQDLDSDDGEHWRRTAPIVRRSPQKYSPRKNVVGASPAARGSVTPEPASIHSCQTALRLSGHRVKQDLPTEHFPGLCLQFQTHRSRSKSAGGGE